MSVDPPVPAASPRFKGCPACGFSLVELLVALALLIVLLAGMVRVFAAGLHGSTSVHEALGAQRALRWGLAGISEDLRAMGTFFPPPGMRPLSVAAPGEPGRQSAFMLVPEQPPWIFNGSTFRPREPGDDPCEPAGKRVDELSFVTDVLAPLGGELTSPVLAPPGPDPESGTAMSGAPPPSQASWITVRPELDLSLAPGDLLWLEDVHFECVRVTAGVALAKGAPGAVPVGPLQGGPAFAFAHASGIRVGFVHALRLVRLAVVYLPLEGAAPEGAGPGPVPCLVRFETPYPEDHLVPRWGALLGKPPALPGRYEVLAENVTGFRVDLSLDLQWPGIRGHDLASTVANLDAELHRLHGRGIGDPLWFRHCPALVSVTLETRSTLARPREVARGPTVRRFAYETQRMVFAPRNFGLGVLP